MKCLELFCGTKSFKKAVPPDWEVISVDILEKFNPDICCDIMDLDYKQWDEGEFDIIWASPPCRFFSHARYAWIGKWTKFNNAILTKEMLKQDELEHGLPPVKKALEIIEYLKPKYWFMENPQTGRLKNHITDKYFIDVDYSQFGYDYRKRTRIWTNRTELKDKKTSHKVKHTTTIGNKTDRNIGLLERYSIPKPLFDYLLVDTY